MFGSGSSSLFRGAANSRGRGQLSTFQKSHFGFLLVLIEHEGGLVGREDIKKKLWPNDTAVDFEHGINSAIKSLRRSLDDSADQPTYIETVPRRGYRLMVPVERIADPASLAEMEDAHAGEGGKAPRQTARGEN